MEPPLKEKLEAVERLTQLFRMERMVHLLVTSVSLVMLLGSTGVLIYTREAGAAELTLMFSSSGLITYSASRLLHMWNQALALITARAPEGET